MVAVHAMLASALAVGSIAFASPQRVIDSGLVVLVRTVGGEVGNGIVVGTNEVATSCSVLAGAAAITVHETWKAPVARPAEGVPAILAARDEEGRACLLFLEEPFWRSPPVELASVSPSGSVAPGVRPNQPLFTVSVAEGYVLTVRTVFVWTPSNPVDREAAAALASRPDPLPAVDRSATPLSDAGTAVFDERGRLVAMTALEPPSGDRNAKGATGRSEPPARILVSARDIAALLGSSAEWRACLASPTPDCVLDEALRPAAGRSRDLSRVARLREQLGDFEGAIRVWRESAATAPRYLVRLAEAQFEAGYRAAAMDSLAAAKRAADEARFRPDHYGGIAAAYSKTGAASEAARLAVEALSLVGEGGRDDFTLAEAAKVQVAAGLIDGALATAAGFRDTRDEGFEWIAEHLLELDQPLDAWRVLEGVQDADEDLLEFTAWEAFRLGQSRVLLRSARAVPEDERRERLLYAVVVAAAESDEFTALLEPGDLVAALSAAEGLGRLDVPRESGTTRETRACGYGTYCRALASIARPIARAGHVAALLKAVGRLEVPEERLLVLREVLEVREVRDDPALRDAVGELSESPLLDRHLDLVESQARIGDYLGAYRATASIAAAPWGVPELDAIGAERALKPTSDPQLNSLKTDWAFTTIARAQAEAGDFDEALQNVNRVGGAFRRLYLLIDVAGAQVAAGQTESARTNFAGAVREADRLAKVRITSGCCLDIFVIAWESIVHSQAKAGLFEDALATTARFEGPNREESFALLKTVHAASARGAFGIALRVQSVMSWRVEALGYIARGLAGLPPGDLPHRID